MEILNNNLRPIGTEFFIGLTKYRVVSYINCYDSETEKMILKEEIVLIMQG